MVLQGFKEISTILTSNLGLTFDFIKNEILKENLAIHLQYIIFLLRHEEINGPIIYSVNKNIILYIASIIEGVLFYTLHTSFDKNALVKNKILTNL